MNDHGLLSFVKKMIHSLVVSTPQVVTIESLKRDYFKEEGTAIPYSRLGFRDLESFLRYITDTVVLVGHGPMSRVLAVSKAQSAHIQQLVQCQRKPKHQPRNRSRGKPKYFYGSQRSNIVFVNEKTNLPPEPVMRRPTKQSYSQNRTVSQCHEIAYQRSMPQENRNYQLEKTITKPNPIKYKAVGNHNNHVEKPIVRSNSIEGEAVTQSFHQMTIEQEVKKEYDNDEIDKMPNWISNKDQWYKDSSEEEQAQSHHKIWLDQDCKNNRQVYENQSDQKEQAQFQNDNWLSNEDQLNRELSTEEQQKVQIAQDAPPDFLDSDFGSPDEGIDDDAIPSYAIDDRVLNLSYPKSAVRSDYELPKRDLPNSVHLGERLLVHLVKIDNPHSFNFWIHDDTYDDYLAMCNNMQIAYNDLRSTDFVMPLYLITTGHLCAVRSVGVWERARVVNYKPGNLKKTIEVELIDTGHTVCVCPKDVCYLYTDFAILPPQCLAGRLAYVTPWKGLAWSAEAVQSFFKQVDYRILHAKVEQVEDAVYLVLLDPESKVKATIKNINVRLIESGLARRCYTP